jgi:hypothetical protein
MLALLFQTRTSAPWEVSAGAVDRAGALKQVFRDN